MKIIFLYLLVFCAIGLARSTSEPNIHNPVIESKYRSAEQGLPEFRGVIKENEKIVTLDPPLKAHDDDVDGAAGLICGYMLTSTKHNIPFVIELLDRRTGLANITLAEGKKLNYEKREHYKFRIVAYDCGEGQLRSNKAQVVIHVQDVDEFPPVFDQDSYFVEMEEGQIFNSIIKVSAHDDDRSPEYRGICSYEIITPDVPFTMDKNGNLKNTEVIHHSTRYNFILQAVAKDCGGLKSKPVSINIKITEICRTGWQGIQPLNYVPNSGQQKVAESAQLKICDKDCIPDQISVKMELATKHIGKGCDRDTYSITSQRKLCGASGDSIDLLPTPSIAANWTRGLLRDDGHESDPIFGFDGSSNAVEVPRGQIDHSLHEHFTLSTWMKHSFPPTVVTNHRKGNKEHVLCMSDGEGMNRHHYAWLVHNEKLVFLLRKEGATAKDMEIFKPAEWRWHLKEINDGQWHHYAISVDFPKVRLYVDGKLLVTDQDNEEVIDDWPLHPSKKVHDTKLVVGACFEGKKKKYEHYFRGYLAGLSMLKDKTESDRVIKCLNNCQENLDFHAVGTMQSGTSVSFNSEMTQFKIKGQNISEVEALVRQVTYVNARTYPTPGRRTLSIRTNVHCGNKEEILPLVEDYIMVQASHIPIITVAGSKFVQTNREKLANGELVFSDVNIHVDVHIPPSELEVVEEGADEDDGYEIQNESTDFKKKELDFKLKETAGLQNAQAKKDETDNMLLDMCIIQAEPPLDLTVEYFVLPQELMRNYNMRLEGSETKAGIVITNADKIKNYETVMRGIQYIHKAGQNLSSRKFILSCSSQNARFVSNQYTVEVVSLHEEPQTLKAVAHAQLSDSVEPQLLQKLTNMEKGNSAASNNFGMVAIIVVCVGFLLFMIVLGVLRIRAAHNKTRVVHVEERQEMEWDNSELNITVNPIDQELFEYEENPMKTSLRDDSDTDDDASSFHDEADSSEEEETGVKTLEWDDSTLSY